MKVGIGYDIHRLVEGRKLVLGGVRIPYHLGLAGHSDADVLAHAICDGLLGAAGEPDIGSYFPDSNESFKDISSMKLLGRVGEIVSEKGYAVANIDAVVIAEEPEIAPFREQIRSGIARVLNIAPGQVNIKATTAEGLGVIGEKKAIACEAVALLEERESKKD